MRKLDLSGKVFGKWTVLRNGEKQNWVCRCECGEEKEIFIGNLRSGKSTSCKKCAAIKNNLIGNKYNKLTVIEDSLKRTKSRNIKWICRCDCGNISEVCGTALLTHKTKSCGKCTTNTFYEHTEGYMVGITSNGKQFIFDKQDLDSVKVHNWCLRKGYANTRIKGKTFSLHRLILNPPNDMEVDHINGDTTNNKRSNLRICTHKENSRNTHKQSNITSSKYKGVSFDKSRNKWEAYLITQDKKIHLGRYESESEAANQYNLKSKELFGEYAKLNEIRAD
jgi:hypothetical protein